VVDEGRFLAATIGGIALFFISSGSSLTFAFPWDYYHQKFRAVLSRNYV
jgi:hypothetical protein